MVRGRQGFRNAAQTLFFDTGSCFAPVGCTNTAVSFVDSAKSIDWFGTLRGRLGYLATPTLLAYMTGGLVVRRRYRQQFNRSGMANWLRSFIPWGFRPI